MFRGCGQECLLRVGPRGSTGVRQTTAFGASFLLTVASAKAGISDEIDRGRSGSGFRRLGLPLLLRGWPGWRARDARRRRYLAGTIAAVRQEMAKWTPSWSTGHRVAIWRLVTRLLTLVANSQADHAASCRAAKREQRVLAAGTPLSQSAILTRLTAAAVITCCR
jgi:hypothetical protein